MKVTSGIFAFSILVLLLISCHSNTTTWQMNEKKMGGSEICIKKPDATAFLQGWKTENVLYVHMASEPPTLHFTNENNANRTIISNLTQHFLVCTDPINRSIFPDLVKAMPQISDDGLHYTYELRTEPTFDDGTPVTVNDVLFSLKVLKSPLTGNYNQKPYLENLVSLTADPKNELRFTLNMKRKYIQNIDFLTECPIMEQKFYDEKHLFDKFSLEQLSDTSFASHAPQNIVDWENHFNGPDVCSNPKFMNGLGAYQITEWKKGTSITLEKKKNHWTEKLKNPSPYETAFAEKIVIIINRDENSEILELKNQNYDVTNFISTLGLIGLSKDENFQKNYNFDFIQQYQYAYIGLNTKPSGDHAQLFTNKNVRRAMALLTPVDQIIQAIVNGKAMRYTNPVSPIRPEYNTELKPIPFDVEQAKKLLDAAGWKDHDGDGTRDTTIDGKKVQFEFALMYGAGNVYMDQVVTMIAEAMKQAGVHLIPTPTDAGLVQQKVKAHDFDAFIGSWAGSSAPEDYAQLWATSSYNGGSNFTGFGNAETDKLIDDIRYNLDTTISYPLSKKFQQIVYDEQPYIFLYAPYRKIIIHKRWGNCIMTFDRPGYVLNNLMLLHGGAMKAGFDF